MKRGQRSDRFAVRGQTYDVDDGYFWLIEVNERK